MARHDEQRATARIRRLRRNGAITAALIAALIAGAAAFVSWRVNQAEAIAESRQWILSGTPCPKAAARFTPADWPRTTRRETYGDAEFAWAYGHMSCVRLAYREGRGVFTYPVCQFSGPVALEVATRKGLAAFAPPRGQGVTVSIPHGRTRCFLGAPEFPTMGQVLREAR